MSVFVADLSLSHFRSHKRSQMVLDGRPVALWGANGAGKTNVLEAVSLLSPGRGLRRAAAEEIARRPETIGWKIRAGIGGHEIEMEAEGGGPRRLLLDGKPAAQVALAGIARIVWLVPAQDRLWIEGAEGRRRFLDRMVMSFVPGHAADALAYDKAMRERNRLLKDGVGDPAWYGALEGQMARAAAAMVANRETAMALIAAAQDGADTAFPAADLGLAEAVDGLRSEADFEETFAAGRGRDMAAGRTLAGPHRTDLTARYAAKDMAAAQCSTGEQKALLISLVLANARALKSETGEPPLVLLDEVAAHLDAGRRAALFDEICALGGQAWMTGTGPELFADLGPRAQGFRVVEEGGSSRIVPESETTP
ncbi:DNA replication/repair protein RecF [Rhodobacterales bacterium HKCCE2091]|nr:DNA replication/repair protein RecF [Rhodobacterales bacterium HKCCE2091]